MSDGEALIRQPLFGILAGMGPRSTAPFLEKILDQCQFQYGASNDEDFPPIMIYSLPTPFYVDRPINHNVMESTIIEGLQELERIGASFVAMPCNSAHVYFNLLSSSISIPLLNMIEIAVENVPQQYKRVALLGTESTIHSGIFQHSLVSNNMQPIHDSLIQNLVNAMLTDVKIRNDIGSAMAYWKSLNGYISELGADVILVACTDLQTIITDSTENKEIDVIDAADCLAERTIRQWLEISN